MEYKGCRYDFFVEDVLNEEISMRVKTGQKASPVGGKGNVVSPRDRDITEIKVNGEFVPLDYVKVQCFICQGNHPLTKVRVMCCKDDAGKELPLFACSYENKKEGPDHAAQTRKTEDGIKQYTVARKLFLDLQEQLMEDLVYDGIEGEVELPSRDELGELFEKLGGSYETDGKGVNFDSVQLDTEKMNEALFGVSQDVVPKDKIPSKKEVNDEGEEVLRQDLKYRVVQLTLKRNSKLAKEHGDGPYYFVLDYRNASCLFQLINPWDQKAGGRCDLADIEVHEARIDKPERALAYAHFGMKASRAYEESRSQRREELYGLLLDGSWVNRFAFRHEQLFGDLFGAIVDAKANKEGPDFQTFWTKRRGKNGQVRDVIDGKVLAEYVLCVERGLPFREEGGDHQPRPIVAGGTDLEIDDLRSLRREPFALLRYFDREQSSLKFFVMESFSAEIMAELLMEMGQFGKRVPKKGEEKKFPRVFHQLPLRPFPLSRALVHERKKHEDDERRAQEVTASIAAARERAQEQPRPSRKRRKRKSAEEHLAEAKAQAGKASRKGGRRSRRRRRQPEA